MEKKFVPFVSSSLNPQVANRITATANRFKEFLNLPPHFNLRNDGETIDIVGFLAYEMVRSLTISGLVIKQALGNIYDIQDLDPAPARLKRKKSTSVPISEASAKRHRAEFSDLSDAERPPVSALFLPPPQARTALRPEHIHDAFARFQRDWSHHRSAGLRNFRGGLVRTNVSLI
jgi:transcription initiation protein SPT3